MNILALDTSSKAASCAIYKGGALLSEFFSNSGLTHSQTIMPMVESMLACSKTEMGDIDVFAVCVGPGSFTGLRIGISAVKGMAFALGKPCAAVSTLEALAFNAALFDGIVVPVMDARRSEVYTAVFKCGGESPIRQCEDQAIPIDELAVQLQSFSGKIMLIGDGARLCHDKLRDIVPGIRVAPENLLHQRAASVCAAAANMDKLVTPEALDPIYLRLPQAEREKLEKQGKSKDS